MNPKSIIKGIQQWEQESRTIRSHETLYHKIISYNSDYQRVVNGGENVNG